MTGLRKSVTLGECVRQRWGRLGVHRPGRIGGFGRAGWRARGKIPEWRTRMLPHAISAHPCSCRQGRVNKVDLLPRTHGTHVAKIKRKVGLALGQRGLCDN